MESIVGKWAGGQGGHMIYEFFHDGEFRTYSTADITGERTIYGKYYIPSYGRINFYIGDSSKENRYGVNIETLRLCPPDGGSPIVFNRVKETLEESYNRLVASMNIANTEQEYISLAQHFGNMNYKNSAELANGCNNQFQILKERRKEEERQYQKRLADRTPVLEERRKEIAKYQGCIDGAVALKTDGTVIATVYDTDGLRKTKGWSGIVAISEGSNHIVGLRADGTVVAVGGNKDGQCKTAKWRDIVAISAGFWFTVGLKADGAVVAIGVNKYGQCDVAHWRDIVAISAGGYHTVGLKADGTVVTAGDERCGIGKTAKWQDIVAIFAGDSYTVGLKTDGTVVAAGDPSYRQCRTENWRDIVAISAGYEHTLGLKADGTVVMTDEKGRNYIEHWQDIVAVSAGYKHMIALKADGMVDTVVFDNYYRDKYDVSGWRDIGPVPEEQALILKRRLQGLCSYCGGTFSFWGKKCKSCSKQKDY